MKIISAALALLFTVPAFAQDTARMEQVIQASVQNKTFMGTVLVARGGDILLNKGYGSANLEWDIPNTPATKFRLGSITKQFTAASILLLEERGKLAISDPIKKHLSDAPAAWDAITIYNLLTHTSGIPNFTAIPEYRKLQPFASPVAKTIESFRDRPLDFAPGVKMSYSNSGYLVLGHLIETITNLNGPSADQLALTLGIVAHGDPVKLTSERKEISVPSSTLSRYVGSYEIRPGMVMRITLDGDRLMAQMTSPKPNPLFPESETFFFLKVVDAQIQFEVDATGTASHLVLHQNGRELKGVRK